jgi:hypothetical protein
MFKLEMKKLIELTYSGIPRFKRVWIYKTIELPFAPFLGLIICDKGFENKITELYWHNNTQTFITDFEDEKIERLYADSVVKALESEIFCGWNIEE